MNYPTKKDKELAKEIEKRLGIPAKCISKNEIEKRIKAEEKEKLELSILALISHDFIPDHSEKSERKALTKKVKKKFGKDMAYMGNIDVRQLSKSREDIDTEINEKIIPAMKGGGYIYHSDHSIPPEVSLDNYIYLMKKLDNLTY